MSLLCAGCSNERFWGWVSVHQGAMQLRTNWAGGGGRGCDLHLLWRVNVLAGGSLGAGEREGRLRLGDSSIILSGVPLSDTWAG